MKLKLDVMDMLLKKKEDVISFFYSICFKLINVFKILHILKFN